MADLYLFDIDGTLVNIHSIHLRAYTLDYAAVVQRDVPDALLLRTFGMSEAEMHRVVFKDLGLPCYEGLIKKLIDHHARNFQYALENNRVVPLRGVVEFLSYLKLRQARIAVVTGNLEGPARLILERSGLRHFFDFVSCDDGESSRKQIVQRALTMAQERYAVQRVIVIGDTMHDVEAGKSIHAFTVGVATGNERVDTLKATNPDLVLESLREYEKIVDAVRKK